MTKTVKHILVFIIVLAMAIPTGIGIVKANEIPTFDIVSVVPDEVVTIETSDFPADMKFDVLIGKYGNFGQDGIKVGTQDSGKGGTFTATYKIPAELKGVGMLAIRLENKETGYYSFNWFENAAMPAEDQKTTPAPAATTEEEVFHPSFTITTVEMDKSITVSGSGFPKDTEYDVLMGVSGSFGVGGEKVSTQKTGAKGEFKATYTIPVNLQGAGKIAVRMESATSDYYAFNYFYNATYAEPVATTAATPKASATEAAVPTKADGAAPAGGEAAYSGYPSFSIVSVKKNMSVKIMADNLPADEMFEVYMENSEDAAAEKVKAGTLETKKGGSAEATFSIPADFKDLNQVTIRLTGTKTGFFAYNFFFNTDFPVAEITPAAPAAATEVAPAPTAKPAPTTAPTSTP